MVQDKVSPQYMVVTTLILLSKNRVTYELLHFLQEKPKLICM